MNRVFGFAAMALCATVVAGPAGAQPSPDELKCQLNASKTVAKFAGAKVKCINKCWAGVRKGTMGLDCDPAGGRDTATQTCIDAAEDKSNVGQGKKCTADCPECYNNADCPADAAGKTATAETLVDTQDSGGPASVHCNGGTVTDVQGKCQDNAAKTLAKLVAALGKCSQKCKGNEAKGKADPGSCTPPATDPATDTCIQAAKAKCAVSLDKKCGAISATPPCWAPAADSGAEWCGVVEGVVNSQYNEFFCGSPSGAFLD
jgi:hypothetical protein